MPHSLPLVAHASDCTVYEDACLQVSKPHIVGRLFAMFLTVPALAVCHVHDIVEPDAQLLSTLEVRSFNGSSVLTFTFG